MTIASRPEPSEAPLLHGFAVRGYRSFHGEIQFVGPLAKVSVISGPNNSGKSNLTRFLGRLGPVVSSSAGEQSFELEGMDRPQLPEGVIPPILTVGIARLVAGNGTAISDFETAHGVSLASGHNDTDLLREVLESVPFGATGVDQPLQWFLWDQVGKSLVPCEEQASAVVATVQRRGQSALFSSAIMGRTGAGDDHELAIRMLRAWAGNINLPSVVHVPAIRSIVATGEPSRELLFSDGTGLPGHLVTLQSPAAETYWEDRARFDRLNSFLQAVLDDPDVVLNVPHDSNTIHIFAGGKMLPLESLGAGLTQLVILAVVATSNSQKLITIDEPEMHLHPTLLRQLVRYLNESTDNQYLLTTHSSALLDDPSVAVVEVNHEADNGTVVRRTSIDDDRARVARNLGYRPSDLMQANCVIWVEGPSDRIYLNAWIHAADDALVEGVHYTVMSYGGALVANLTALDIDSPGRNGDLVSLVRINRNTAMLLDSDIGSSKTPLQATKQRLLDELDKRGGFGWITHGRMIENYIPIALFNAAARKVHSSWKPAGNGKYVHRFSKCGLKSPSKVRIAEVVLTEPGDPRWGDVDLVAQVDSLVSFIAGANEHVFGSTQGTPRPSAPDARHIDPQGEA